MHTKLVNFRGSIVIYYRHGEKIMRLTTGVSKIPQDEKYFKNGVLTAKVEDHVNKNNIIAVKLKEVDDVISDFFFAKKVKPSIDYVKSALVLEQQKMLSAETKFESFEYYYDMFFEEKKLDALAPSSLKDYKSLQNSLRLYQHCNGKLTLDIMNSADFLKKLEAFLSIKHSSKEFKKFRTSGGLNVNTTKKRISTVLTFLKWCEGREILKRKFEVENFKTKLKKYQPTVVIITREEKDELLKLNLKGDEEKIRDIFVFLYLTGMRYSDLLTLHPGFCMNGYIIKEAEKTDLKFKVPLTKKATEILEKYKCRMNMFPTNEFNIRIKELLKMHNICCYPIRIKNVIFAKTEYTDVLKYTQIGSHTGRRSFIANCVITGHSIPEIMAMTGHSQLISLQSYIDQFQSQKDAITKIQLLD